MTARRFFVTGCCAEACRIADPSIAVITFDTDVEQGLALFEARLDKGYSITDCISMNTMGRIGATEVLTLDHHFAQEGFNRVEVAGDR